MRDFDIQTGITETFHKDNDTGKIHIKSEKDLTGFLNFTKNARDNDPGGFKGDMHKMASIDPFVIVMWTEEMKKHGYPNTNPLAVENRKFLLAKLNSPEWNCLRTKQGVI